VLPHAGEAVGAVLNGQWKLVRLVGEGGLAAVYEAEGQQGQGKRAIKLLHSQFVSNRAIVERFYAEAKACFALRHPHICAVEAYAYAEDGTPYMVMELLEGMSLEEYLRGKQPMPPETASPILYGILQALSAAHANGIIHRDLKPANIFLVPEGDGKFAVKVLDFGIAKVMDVAGGMGSKTRTGAVLGTPGYMSPEQVKNAKAVDARTDLWAAGVVFYEMLTCKHPFGSSDQLARMVAVLRDPPTPISQVADHLASWGDFFEKALARDPNARYQSAQEMTEALRAQAQGTPARFVPEGLQTVAIPAMPDMTAQRQAGAPSVVQVAGGPATQGSAQAAPSVAVEQPVDQRTSALPQYSSAPPPPQHPSQAPPHAASVVPGAPRPPGLNTQISGDRPAGTPTYHQDAPRVDVMMARDKEPPALVWWGVMVLTVGAFALGVLVGYVLGY
jgi:serine/threonine-protein kinase